MICLIKKEKKKNNKKRKKKLKSLLISRLFYSVSPQRIFLLLNLFVAITNLNNLNNYVVIRIYMYIYISMNKNKEGMRIIIKDYCTHTVRIQTNE